ncbi:MAG: hypothetical protein R3194_07200, partial [Limnobacter sp.]|nr:hypothetical protein [Limnobacter sp.]
MTQVLGNKPARVLAATSLLLLGACMGSADSPADSSSNATGQSSGMPSTFMAQQGQSGLGCGWQFASDADRANIAFPDTNAKYWVALAPLTPNTRIRIDGQYPDARYFSYNSYDAALRPTDAIADIEIDPAGQGNNPFTKKNGQPGGDYTAYLEFGDSPTQNPDTSRAPNTFYSGNIQAGPIAAPNGTVLVPIIYRIYISNAGDFFNGGV